MTGPAPAVRHDARPLVADGVRFAYPNGVQVIDDWSATLAPGEVTALTGPSGSGKSTLLYLLGLMHRQTGGEIILHGQATSTLHDAERARLRAHWFGFVFQDAALDPSRTVLDNVCETALYRGEPRRHATQRAGELMAEFGVGLRARHKPGQVSGGQAQRIALCRALLADPPYLLADEPTGNLDPATRDVVVQAFRDRAAAGACVVIATHDPTVVAACDREIALGGPLAVAGEVV